MDPYTAIHQPELTPFWEDSRCKTPLGSNRVRLSSGFERVTWGYSWIHPVCLCGQVISHFTGQSQDVFFADEQSGLAAD